MHCHSSGSFTNCWCSSSWIGCFNFTAQRRVIFHDFSTTKSSFHHFFRILAPAFLNTTQESSLDLPNECILGILPHSIRGFLSTFSVVLPAVERYKQCVACSSVVIDEYEKKGFEFLLQVFNSSKYLEELTGLKELYEQIDQGQVVLFLKKKYVSFVCIFLCCRCGNWVMVNYRHLLIKNHCYLPSFDCFVSPYLLDWFIDINFLYIKCNGIIFVYKCVLFFNFIEIP